ncbi:unnamed protein product [Closterium sp. NIES-53]
MELLSSVCKRRGLVVPSSAFASASVSSIAFAACYLLLAAPPLCLPLCLTPSLPLFVLVVPITISTTTTISTTIIPISTITITSTITSTITTITTITTINTIIAPKPHTGLLFNLLHYPLSLALSCPLCCTPHPFHPVLTHPNPIHPTPRVPTLPVAVSLNKPPLL